MSRLLVGCPGEHYLLCGDVYGKHYLLTTCGDAYGEHNLLSGDAYGEYYLFTTCGDAQ